MCHNYNKNVSNYTDDLDIQGRNENLVSDTTKAFTIQMRIKIRYKCLSFEVMEHTIGKSIFEMFVNLHLIINNKEIKNAHYFSHFSLSRKLYL